MADDVSEDVCDSWEDMIENGILEKKLEELTVKAEEKPSKTICFVSWWDSSKSRDFNLKLWELISCSGHNRKYNEGSEGQCVGVPQVMLEDSSRTPYMPQVKILKRPSDARFGGNGEKSPNRQPVKTLQQREAEYAEARRRILGSGPSEDETQKVMICRDTINIIDNKCDGNNVVRQPRGPDGTSGFACRR
ncbi:SUZ RNA-binding domain-containing-like isoform X1 [Tachypleus tridentatus]|uniref:SUZ RNA-binding domain-containing-like isoform X1 n=1 Tax=Tachypleus tridentatus TaxID=6853 RepID=UPI003FD5C645